MKRRNSMTRATAIAVGALVLTGIVHAGGSGGVVPASVYVDCSQSLDELRVMTDDDGLTVRERYEAAVTYERCLTRGLTGGTGFKLNDEMMEPSAMSPIMLRELLEEARERKIEAENELTFKGMKWGLGLGWSISDGDVVEDAALVNGVIRATVTRNEQAKVILEGHHYIACDRNGKNGQRGCGPFVGVVADSDDVLDGVALGWMFGFKSKKPQTDNGFSIGIGALLENDVRDLADGFHDGEPLPAGETEIRFIEEGRFSLVVFATRTF